MFRLDFSPYEFKKNPVTSNMTVVRYIPVAVTVSFRMVATTAGTRMSTPENWRTNPRFPKMAFTGGLISLGGVLVALRMTSAIVCWLIIPKTSPFLLTTGSLRTLRSRIIRRAF